MADLVKETGAGLSTANSYADVDDGDSYHETRLHISTWSSATETQKETALVWASKMLDRMVNWNGTRYSSTQGLRWPRVGALTPDGYTIESTEIPQDIIDAVCELARELISKNRTAESGTLGLKSFKAGSLELEWDKYDRAPTVPTNVWQMVRFYGTKVGSKQAKTLVRM